MITVAETMLEAGDVRHHQALVARDRSQENQMAAATAIRIGHFFDVRSSSACSHLQAVVAILDGIADNRLMDLGGLLVQEMELAYIDLADDSSSDAPAAYESLEACQEIADRLAANKKIMRVGSLKKVSAELADSGKAAADEIIGIISSCVDFRSSIARAKALSVVTTLKRLSRGGASEDRGSLLKDLQQTYVALAEAKSIDAKKVLSAIRIAVGAGFCGNAGIHL